MLPPLSLRLRLLLLIAVVLAAGALIGAGLSLVHAGGRIRGESEAAARLAVALAQSIVADRVPWSAAPRAEFAALRTLRHLRVGFADEAAPPPSRPAAPEWFSALMAPPRETLRLDAGRAGVLVISTDSSDEIAEIWQELSALALGGLASAAAAFVLASVAVSKTLRPLGALADGLAGLEHKDYALRVSPGGAPDFSRIADRVNALAATLERLDGENRRLLRRMLQVQDEERRDIARDLHDEFGPFLFTLRAGLGALARKAASGDAAAVEQGCARLDAQLAELQQVNRRILGRLRPAALEEMGLADALEALAAGWREMHPQVTLELDVAAARAPLAEDIALTAYRIAQEGLTNAYRHSGADHVALRVSRDEGMLSLEVTDNGAGLSDAPAGLGLRGMSERVAALGGRLETQDGPGQGARLLAILPLSGNTPGEGAGIA